IKRIGDFFDKGQLSEAVECAKQLYVLLPEDAECCDIYAEVLQALAIALAETDTRESLTQAKEYLTTALEVVKSAEIKNQIAANLELLKSRTGTSGGRETMEGETQTIKITTERALQMLRAGEAGIKAWNQFRAIESYIPSLEGVDLSGQNLRNANLSGANLKNSKFIKAVLSYVNFSNSNLAECDFTEAQLYHINFNNADIESANLTSVRCYDSNCVNANLQNAILNKSTWSEQHYKTDFQGANLSGASVIGASLWRCNLEGANLTRTNFSNANLSEANLKNTIIADTDFRGTDLREADLTGANAYCFGFYDGNTKISETEGID
ncbi:MAG: pentapeptide repeat-containing protein, partial [Dolichospermum sp.]